MKANCFASGVEEVRRVVAKWMDFPNIQRVNTSGSQRASLNIQKYLLSINHSVSFGGQNHLASNFYCNFCKIVVVTNY
jgi:hypothetical protein